MEKNIVMAIPPPQKIMDKANFSISQYLKEETKLFIDRTAVVNPETDETRTFSEVFKESYRISNYLKEFGCGKGTIIAVVLENRLEYLSILLGILNIGAICSLLKTEHCLIEMSHAFSILQLKVVFTSNVAFDKIKKVCSECSSAVRVINIDSDKYLSSSMPNTYLLIEPSRPTDTALISFSSGTTGLLKGVRLSHKSFILSLEFTKLGSVQNLFGTNLFLLSSSIGNIGTLMQMLYSFATGQISVPIKHCGEEIFLNYVEKYKPNFISVPTSFILSLSKNLLVSKYDLSSLKCILVGGDFLSKEMQNNLILYFNKCTIVQAYGLTELTGRCTQFRRNETLKSGSVGFLIPGMMAKVIDLCNKSVLGPNQKGELLLKGPILMNGYCLYDGENDLGLDENGWFHTGDIFYYDNELYFYFVERIKELIKYQNYKVFPAELELILLEHDAVHEVGVVGIPDDEAGELPRAYVVKQAGYDDLTEVQLQQHVEERLAAPWKKLRGGIIFTEKLPKTASGKISRKELKKFSLEKLDQIS